MTGILNDIIQDALDREVDQIFTTYAAFIGFDDLMDFLKEASDNGLAVIFAPMKDTK